MSELNKAEQREFDKLLGQITPPPDGVRRVMTPTEQRVLAFDVEQRLELAKLRASKAPASKKRKTQRSSAAAADGLTNKQREMEAKLTKQRKAK